MTDIESLKERPDKELDRAHELMQQWYEAGNPDWEILHRLIASEGYAETALEEWEKANATIAKAGNDIRILLAQIDWLCECCGENLEDEDAALYAQIKADYPAPTQQQEKDDGTVSDLRTGNRDLDNHAQDGLRGRMVAEQQQGDEYNPEMVERLLELDKQPGERVSKDELDEIIQSPPAEAAPMGVCSKSYNDEVCVKSYSEPSPQADAGEELDPYLIDRLRESDLCARLSKHFADGIFGDGDKELASIAYEASHEIGDYQEWVLHLLNTIERQAAEIERMRGLVELHGGVAALSTAGSDKMTQADAGSLRERYYSGHHDASFDAALSIIERQAAEIADLKKIDVGAVDALVDPRGARWGLRGDLAFWRDQYEASGKPVLAIIANGIIERMATLIERLQKYEKAHPQLQATIERQAAEIVKKDSALYECPIWFALENEAAQ